MSHSAVLRFRLRSFAATRASLTLAVASMSFACSAQAASATWTGTTDGTWATGSNWGGTPPGSTVGATNTDTATFNDAGNGNTSITVDASRNLQFITFDTASVAAYTIGSAGVNGGNALTFTNGGKISLTSTVTATETFNAPLSLAGSMSLENLNTTTGRLVVAGNITNTAASTIQLFGATGSTAVNVISGNIVQGTGTLAVTVNSGATNVWELSGANNYNGATTVNFASAGSLTFSGTNAGTGGLTLSKGVAILNNTTNGGIGSGTIAMNGGTLTVGSTVAAPLSLSNAATFTANTTVNGANSLTLNGDFTNTVFIRTLTNSITGSTNSLSLAGNVYLSNVATGVSGYTLALSGSGNTNISGIIQDSSVAVNSGGANLSLSTGTFTLSGANTYTGTTTITGSSKVNVSNVGNSGSASNLGSGSTVNIGSGTTAGTLVYTGAGETSNKVINLGGTTGGATIDQSGASGLLKFTTDLTATGTGLKAFTLQGSTAGTGEIAGAIVENSTTNLTRLIKSGTGTWTLSGNNSYTGSTTLNAGTLKLDYATNNTSKLSNTAVNGTLLLNGGTLELAGGSHAETVLSTTLNTGGTFIKRTSGTSTLSLGAISFSGGAIDFGADSIATTSSVVTNGILSQRATVAGANFAMKSGSDIVAYDYLTSGSTGYTGGTTAANINYAIAGSGSMTANRGAATNTFKITTTGAGQSLAIDTGVTFTSGAILFAGAHDYAITTAGTGKIANTLLHNYGTGTLALGALNVGLTQYGTGKTILTAAATADNALTVNGGTVQFSNNLQIGTNATVKAITLNNGTVIADTTGGSIALDNAGAFSRTVAIGNGGGTIDVIGGNTLTVSGVISGAAGTGPVTFGSATSNGTINLNAVNTYTGATIIRGGTLALGAANRIADTSNLVMAGGTFATGGFSETLGTLTLSANSIIDLGSGASALAFFNSSNATWSSSVSLSFINFTLGQDSIRIGTSADAITGTQLAQITINGFSALIDSSGFLTASAVPEPSSAALLAGAIGLFFVAGRRKRHPGRAA